MPYGETLAPEVEEVAKVIVDAAFAIHTEYGPGLLESIYELCLAHELAYRGMRVLRQVRVPLVHRGVELGDGFRMDLVINESVVVEVKSVAQYEAIYAQQLKTYLKLSGHCLGLLINFNVPLIKDGIKRVICTPK